MFNTVKIWVDEQPDRSQINGLLNSAAVLVTADLAPDLPTGIALAAKTIDSGAVTALVSALAISQPTEP